MEYNWGEPILLLVPHLFIRDAGINACACHVSHSTPENFIEFSHFLAFFS